MFHARTNSPQCTQNNVIHQQFLVCFIYLCACKFELARMPLIAVGICHYQSMRFKSETSEIMFEIQITCMLIIYKHQSNNPSWLTVIRCAVCVCCTCTTWTIRWTELGWMDFKHEKGIVISTEFNKHHRYIILTFTWEQLQQKRTNKNTGVKVKKKPDKVQYHSSKHNKTMILQGWCCVGDASFSSLLTCETDD